MSTIPVILSAAFFAFIGLADAQTKPATTRPTAAIASTAPATQPALTLAESDRMLARKIEEAAQHYEQAIQSARNQRLRQLRQLQEKAMSARDLDQAMRIKGLIAATEAEMQSAAAAAGDKAPRRTPSLRIVGNIDGKNLLVIRQDRARWMQQQYGYPGGVMLNGVHWDPSKSDTLDNAGPTMFLPGKVNLRNAALVKKTGRNMVEVVADNDEVRIAFDDTDPGAGRYDLLIEFAPAAASGSSPPNP